MKYFTLLLLLVSVSACGQSSIVPGEYVGDIDEEFHHYVDEYKQIMETPYVFVSMNMVDSLKKKDPKKKGNIIGRCYYKSWLIHISNEYWVRADEYQREALIWHEMMHCVHKQHGHREGEFLDGCKNSYMSAYQDSSWCLKKHRKALIGEMRRSIGL